MTMEQFTPVKILDNFYQTSSFFPMPVVLISTLSESGQVNLGPYSLCFPHVIARKHAMILIARSNSNTAMNIKRTGVAAINFIELDKKMMKNCVMIGYPGETTAEKMRNSMFTLTPSQRTGEERLLGIQYPDIVAEAFQVFECTWDNAIDAFEDEETLEMHFVLRIDKILLKPRWYKALLGGKGFPTMPVDFGFRNNANFWLSKNTKPWAEPIPKDKKIDVNSVIYAAKRIDPDIAWDLEACKKLVKVPRAFLGKVLRSCIEAAKQQGMATITPEFLDTLRDKRSKEKS
jgi:flavin reductase (DIM6/NTAB) family NADH-FMN oxidoreductase RutF